MIVYWSTWHELVCPQCKEHNFVDDGDTTDLTVDDIEGCKCWNCSYCFDFEGEVVDEDVCDKGMKMVKQDVSGL